jgi:hypothetical protein
MAVYDLYGTQLEHISTVKAVLESILGIQFELHNSSYHGGDYYLFGMKKAEHFVLKKNLDPVDKKPAEQSFPLYSILLYVNDTQRAKNLLEKLTQGGSIFTLLRHEDIP